MHLLVFMALSTAVLPVTPGSFTTAKKRALEVTEGSRTTLYCGCAFLPDKSLDHTVECSYSPHDLTTVRGLPNRRAKRIEWEHIVTAHRMGKHRKCWAERSSISGCYTSSGRLRGSRACCRIADPEFRAMENDLHNLWPVVGELNGDRSVKEFGSLYGERRNYGTCDFEVGLSEVEVREEAQGEVARAYLYMEDTWGVWLSVEEKIRYLGWNARDPPSDWELERDRRIAAIQGNHNSYVVDHEQVRDGKRCRTKSSCCRVCRVSSACGNGCISTTKSCSKQVGCACDQTAVCLP